MKFNIILIKVKINVANTGVIHLAESLFRAADFIWMSCIGVLSNMSGKIQLRRLKQNCLNKILVTYSCKSFSCHTLVFYKRMIL